MAEGKARLPPRWFIVTFWHVHRRVVQATRGRKGCGDPVRVSGAPCGLRRAAGAVGEPRSVIVGYYEEGSS